MVDTAADVEAETVMMGQGLLRRVDEIVRTKQCSPVLWPTVRGIPLIVAICAAVLVADNLRLAKASFSIETKLSLSRTAALAATANAVSEEFANLQETCTVTEKCGKDSVETAYGKACCSPKLLAGPLSAAYDAALRASVLF